MTWYEAEQIEGYLNRLERMLDEWSLGPLQMRIEAAELMRTLQKVQREQNNDTRSPIFVGYLSQLKQRIEHCRVQLEERLKRK